MKSEDEIRLDMILIGGQCIFLLFNVAGNSLVIYIISKKQRTSTDYLLLNMAISDLVFGVFAIFFQFIPHISRLLGVSVFHSIFFKNHLLCRTFTTGTIAWMAALDSVFTMVTLSLERYFAVCRPHSFKKWFSKGNVKFMIVLGWGLSLLFNIPNFMLKCTVSEENLELIRTHALISVALGSVTLLVLSVLSVKIYISLWCKQTTIQPTAVREIEERKTKKKVTLCVLAVVLTFIVCYIPSFINYTYTSFSNPSKYTRYLFSVTIFLMSLNSSLDPFLFSFQNPRMKAFLRKLFMCKRHELEREQPQEQQLSRS